jgi:ankyrin repeat protein
MKVVFSTALILLFLGCTESIDDKITSSGYYPDETGFFHAVKSEDEAAVKLFLEKKININQTDGNGATALFYAAQLENSKLSQLLIKNGAGTVINDNSKKTPLHYAAESCSAQNVKLLLEKGVDPKWKDNYSRTAFLSHLAKAEKECTEVFDILIKVSDINDRDKDRKTALIYSVEKNFEEYTRKLIELKANPLAKDYKGMTALDHALKNLEDKKSTEEFVEKIRNYTSGIKLNL